jgi:hypothetical protein
MITNKSASILKNEDVLTIIRGNDKKRDELKELFRK